MCALKFIGPFCLANVTFIQNLYLRTITKRLWSSVLLTNMSHGSSPLQSNRLSVPDDLRRGLIAKQDDERNENWHISTVCVGLYYALNFLTIFVCYYRRMRDVVSAMWITRAISVVRKPKSKVLLVVFRYAMKPIFGGPRAGWSGTRPWLVPAWKLSAAAAQALNVSTTNGPNS